MHSGRHDLLSPSPWPATVAYPLTVSGHLQVMAEDGWGSVCSESFDLKDANKACKELGHKNLNGQTLWVQSPGIGSAALRAELPDIKFIGGCCRHGDPEETMFYKCGAEGAPKCTKCDDVVVLTFGSEP